MYAQTHDYKRLSTNQIMRQALCPTVPHGVAVISIGFSTPNAPHDFSYLHTVPVTTGVMTRRDAYALEVAIDKTCQAGCKIRFLPAIDDNGVPVNSNQSQREFRCNTQTLQQGFQQLENTLTDYGILEPLPHMIRRPGWSSLTRLKP